jgi:hypothetical protein
MVIRDVLLTGVEQPERLHGVTDEFLELTWTTHLARTKQQKSTLVTDQLLTKPSRVVVANFWREQCPDGTFDITTQVIVAGELWRVFKVNILQADHRGDTSKHKPFGNEPELWQVK